MKKLLAALALFIVADESKAQYYAPPPRTTMVTTVYIPMIVAAGAMSYQKSEVSPQTRDATNKTTYGVSNVNKEDNSILSLVMFIFCISFALWRLKA